jgi:hypothetical protein
MTGSINSLGFDRLSIKERPFSSGKSATASLSRVRCVLTTRGEPNFRSESKRTMPARKTLILSHGRQSDARRPLFTTTKFGSVLLSIHHA